MNIGLYSFKTMNVNEINKLSEKLNDKFIYTKNIYIYSENTSKQKLSKRIGLEKIIKDYEKKKISLIAVKSINSFGSDAYINSEILMMLKEKEISFFIIDEDIESKSDVARKKIDIINFIEKTAKEENDKRSRIGKIIKEQMK